MITIAGLGRANTTDVSPMPLSEYDHQPSTSVFDDEYRTMIVRGSINIGAQSFSPLGGDPRHGTLEFSIQLNDDRRPEIGRYFFEQARQAVAVHTTTIGVNSTVLQLDTGQVASSGIISGDIIYTEREAFRVEVTDIFADTVTIVDKVDDGAGGFPARSLNITEGVQGHFATRVRVHEARGFNDTPPYIDDRIWLQTPFIRGREVYLWFSDGENLETLVGRYRIEGTRTQGGNTTLRVRCRDFLSALKGRKFNRPAFKGEIVNAGPSTFNSNAVYLSGLANTQGFRGGVRAVPFSIYQNVSTAGQVGVYQVGRACFVSDDQLNLSADIAGGTFVVRFIPETRFGGEAPGDIEQLAGKSINEILVSHPTVFEREQDHPYYTIDTSIAGGVAGIPQHPFDLLRAHLGTIDTGLPRTWRLFRTTAEALFHVDDAEIVRIRDSIFDGQEFPGVIAGKDGKPEKALDWLTKTFLQPYMAGFAFQSEGKLTVRSLVTSGAFQITAFTEAALLPVFREEQHEHDQTIDVISVETEIGIDGQARTLLLTRSAYDQRMFPHDDEDLDISAAGLVSADDGLGKDTPGFDAYIDILTRIAELLRRPPSIYVFEASGLLPAYPGQLRTVTAYGLRDPDTGLVPRETVSIFGVVLRRDFDSATYGQTIQILAFPFQLDGLIAATASIVTVTHGAGETTLGCSATSWILEDEYEYVQTASDVWQTIDEDVSQFSVGQVCVVRDNRGVIKSDPWEVNSISPGGNIIRGSDLGGGRIQNVGGGGDLTFASGDVVTLGQLGDSLQADLDQYSWFGADEYVL